MANKIIPFYATKITNSSLKKIIHQTIYLCKPYLAAIIWSLADFERNNISPLGLCT